MSFKDTYLKDLLLLCRITVINALLNENFRIVFDFKGNIRENMFLAKRERDDICTIIWISFCFILILELRDAFRLFDKDGDGSISTEYLVSAMGGLGHVLTPGDLQRMNIDGKWGKRERDR